MLDRSKEKPEPWQVGKETQRKNTTTIQGKRKLSFSATKLLYHKTVLILFHSGL